MSNKLLAWLKGDNSSVDSEDSHDATFDVDPEGDSYQTDEDGTWFEIIGSRPS